MIIIKTKTGETLVNEHEIVAVVHDRDKHTAHINDKQVGFGLCRPPIDKVESVVYINDQTGKDWKEDGSELEYLRKRMESLRLELQCQTEITKRTKERLRQLGHDCVQWVQYHHEEMPKDLCERMRKRGEEEKAYVNNHDDWTYRIEWMQNHQKSEEIEADEVARLNTIIEAQAAEIRELKNEVKRKEANERMREVLHADEKKPWWHRIITKEHE